MKKASVGLVFVFAVIAMMTSGCATFLSGTTQTITVLSNPPGAHVVIGPVTGTTPAMLEVQKGKDRQVEVTFGRNKQVFALTRTVDPATFFNLIPPFWPGLIVDAMTGAMMKYEQDRITVDFTSAHLTRYSR